MNSEDLISQLSHPAFTLNLDLKIQAANAKARSWLGLEDHSDQIPWDQGLGFYLKPLLSKLVEHGSSVNEIIVGDADGGIRPSHVLAQRVSWRGENLIWVQSLPMSEAMLGTLNHESHVLSERVTLALRSRRMGFFDWNVQDDVLIWDKTQYEIFGVKASQFRSAYEAWESTLDPETKAKAIEDVQMALKGLRPYDVQFEILTAAGEKRIIRGTGICFWDESGKPTRLIGLNWDVTHQRKLEEQVLQQARLTQKITEAMPSFLIVGDRQNNKMSFVNRRLSELLDLSEDEIRNIPLQELGRFVHKEDLHKFSELISRIPSLSDQEASDTDLRIVSSKGIEKWVHLKSQVFERDEFGSVIASITSGTDISDRIRLQRESELDRSIAVNSSKMAALGEMAGGIAHEINNPLTIIVGRTEHLRKILEKSTPVDQTAFDDLDRIIEVCQRIAKIIRGMKALTRGDEFEAYQPLPITQVVEDVLGLCHQRMNALDIRLEVGRIPDIVLDLRPIQISQILLNLLNNAVDAITKLPERWIQIEFRESADQLRISVVDSGKGIAPEIARRMTEPFYTTKDVGKGTGLGLSISISMAEKHHGSLIYDSTAPNTRFVLTIPKRQDKIHL